MKTAHVLGLRTVQLHGGEPPSYAAQLAPLRVIKALSFDPEKTTELLVPWTRVDPPLAAVLWDTPVQPSGSDPARRGVPPPAIAGEIPEKTDPPTEPTGPSDLNVAGGSGRPWDWSIWSKAVELADLQGLPRFILAGGLTPENIGRAMSAVNPYAVDVSSGVESSRGVKDPKRIYAFCEAVRRADARAGR